MKKNKMKFSITAIGLLLAMVLLPTFALADTIDPPPPSTGSGFVNPLGSITTISALLIKIINWLLGLVGLLALLALIYGGIKLIISLGNESGVQTAKSIIFWAIAGLTVVIVSYAILTTVGKILGAL